MTTPIDRAMTSRNLLLGFAAVVTGVALYSIWRGDIFPSQQEVAHSKPAEAIKQAATGSKQASPSKPSGPELKGDPAQWTEQDMRSWLSARNLEGGRHGSRHELQAEVLAIMHAPGNEQDNSAGQEDPHGDPNQWSEEEMRHWLHNRNIMAGHGKRHELLAEVLSTMHAPK